jgi:putative N6-adenine-specific DNA methylase
MTMHTAFAIVTPGFEPVVEAELRALGATDAAAEPGGVTFHGDDALLLDANLRLRAATRIVVRIAEFTAKSFSELERRAKPIPWQRYVAKSTRVGFRVTCKKSRLYHSGAVEVTAIGDDEDEAASAVPTQLFVVRILRDVCTISADSSGELLHRRGYRLATAKAPIRETIAAGCLLALGYDGSQTLLDPMCGAGTIPIEAALIARNLAPGIHRTFACERWPSFELKIGVVRRAVARAQERPAAAPILGSDRDAGAVESALANAKRAGISDVVTLEKRALSAAESPAPNGLLFANPPYGTRIGEAADLRNLYAQLGNVARTHFAGWRVALVSGDSRLDGHTRLALEDLLRFSNGGIKVRLVATMM